MNLFLRRSIWTFFCPILRAYVYLAWYAQQVYEILTKKRDRIMSIHDLTVIYDENGLIVLDKNPELLINSTKPWKNVLTLQMQVFFRYPEYANFELGNLFYFINRLDAPTSGLICLAYTSKMAGMACRAFQHRTVEKKYLAIVWGHVSENCANRSPVYERFHKYVKANSQTMTSNACERVCFALSEHQYLIDFAVGGSEYIWSDGRRQTIVVPAIYSDCQHPQNARTWITVLRHGYINSLPASLLLLKPETGRRHQLRIHCAVGLGHPIVGDLIYARLYARSAKYEAANYPLSRMMLHASFLNLELRPKIPYIKGLKKQAQLMRSQPEPFRLEFRSTQDLIGQSAWVDHRRFFHSD